MRVEVGGDDVGMVGGWGRSGGKAFTAVDRGGYVLIIWLGAKGGIDLHVGMVTLICLRLLGSLWRRWDCPLRLGCLISAF